MLPLQNRITLFLLKTGLPVLFFLLLDSSATSQGLDWKTQDSLLQIYGHQGDSVMQMENVKVLKFKKNLTHPDDPTIEMPQEFECRVYDNTLVWVRFNYTSASEKNTHNSFFSSEHSMELCIVDHELRDFHESKDAYQNEFVNNSDTIHRTYIEHSSVHLVLYKNQLIFQMSDGHDLGAEETFDGESYALENFEYVMEEIRKEYPWIK